MNLILNYTFKSPTYLNTFTTLNRTGGNDTNTVITTVTSALLSTYKNITISGSTVSTANAYYLYDIYLTDQDDNVLQFVSGIEDTTNKLFTKTYQLNANTTSVKIYGKEYTNWYHSGTSSGSITYTTLITE